MKIVLQRVSSARCEVDGLITGEIGVGYVALIGFGAGDDRVLMEKMFDKMLGLRLFADDQGKTNLSLAEVGGGILAISQFTLYADCRKGRRPSFIDALAPGPAEALYNESLEYLRAKHAGVVAAGRFAAHMLITLTNDGPVTITLDSKEILPDR